MGFGSVYRSLKEIFPQIDERILKAVALEHPKDADEAAAVVLSEIAPSFTFDSSHNLFQSSNMSSGSISESEVERGLEDAIYGGRYFAGASTSSSSSEMISLDVDRNPDSSTPSTELVSNLNELTNLSPNVGRDVCHEDFESEKVQSLRKAHGKEHENSDCFDECFDGNSNAKLCLHVPEDDSSAVVSAIPEENVKLTSESMEDCDFRLTWKQAENSVSNVVNSTPGDDTTAIQQGSCFELVSASTNVVDESTNGSLVCENGDTEIGEPLSASSHVYSADYLEEIIKTAKNNKNALLSEMKSVKWLGREVELRERDAENSKEEADRGGLDTLQKVEELKKILEHAKEANAMHSVEVYGEKSVLVTEAKELENRLLSLSEERNKSLAVLDEMRGSLEIRLAAALEMKRTAEQEKKEKEDSALRALVEQEANMEKVVQESKLLQQEADENTKLREFLLDRGQIVDSLQGEISVICQDVNLLKEKVDNRVSLTKSISSRYTSSSGSSVKNLISETPPEPLNGVSETSSYNNIPEAATSSMNKERDYCKELLEDGWDIFDEENFTWLGA